MDGLSLFQRICLFLPLAVVPLWFWLRLRERLKDREGK